MLRRGIAIVAVALAVAAGVWAVLAALPHVKHEVDAPPTVAAPPAPRTFRVIFPEGFTRGADGRSRPGGGEDRRAQVGASR